MNGMNKWFYGVGTIGRDMVYALVGMYLIYYLTNVLKLSDAALLSITFIMMGLRVFDALNDPFMGVIVDNTKSRFGKFKPWIFSGALLASLFTVLLFTDLGLSGGAFIAVFTVLYLLWGISYTANDISYWSMLPALSQNQKERERIGAKARIFANIGSFSVVVGIVPITAYLTGIFQSEKKAYFILSIFIVIIMLVFQMIMLLTVKEDKNLNQVKQTTPVKELFSVIIKNDQLLWTTISMALFMIGYMTTISFGLYYFEYIFGDKNAYGQFAAVLGISQIAALIVFPHISKFLTRKKMYGFATLSVVIGYLMLYIFDKMIITILAAGVLIFFGQAFIQLLMLMFIADSVEYGQLKLGRRNDSITFSLQPLINKMGGAIAAGIVGLTVVVTGIKNAAGPQDLSTSGIFFFKNAMLIFPLICIVLGYFIYSKKYIIDEKKYSEILEQLENRI